MRRTLFALTAGMVAVAATLPGVPSAGAITGGDEADDGEWPWQVAMFVGGEQWCGGSLLSYDVVLTAAHCTDGLDASEIEVRAGTIDLSDDDAGQRRDVREVRQHEDYDDIEIRNDISLLVLGSSFDEADGVHPVSLPDPTTAGRLTGGGDPAYVTGFGATAEGDPASDVLLEASIDIVDDGRCRSEYQQDGSNVFTDSQVCAGRERGHVDACFGDSGGPLVVPSDSSETEWLLVGIVSWGVGCGRAFRPTVYTEVSAFLPWLADHGAGSPDGDRFASDELIRVPAVGTKGKAGRYPSTVEVDEFDGDVHEVAVELQGVSHGRPRDLDVWLVAPDGTVVTLVSDAGGTAPLVDRTLVVVVGGPLAGEGPLPIQIGATNLGGADAQRKGREAVDDLGALEGVDPLGHWQLLVADDEQGSSGQIEGWTLILN